MNNHSNERNTEMYDEELIYDLADLFKVFADSTRIRILHCLLDNESCVGDIATALEMSQTAISNPPTNCAALSKIKNTILNHSHMCCCLRPHAKSSGANSPNQS